MKPPKRPKPPKGSLLRVLWRAEDGERRNGRRFTQWKCQCVCGETIVIEGCKVANGHTKSCGCLRREQAKKRLVKATAVKMERFRERQMQCSTQQ